MDFTRDELEALWAALGLLENYHTDKAAVSNTSGVNSPYIAHHHKALEEVRELREKVWQGIN